jgi:hypothetical protein
MRSLGLALLVSASIMAGSLWLLGIERLLGR